MTGALSTDLYEITMAAGYHASGRLERATFELWVRELPPERGYLVVAGLDQALEYLETLRFLAEDVAYLRTVPALQRVKAALLRRVSSPVQVPRRCVGNSRGHAGVRRRATAEGQRVPSRGAGRRDCATLHRPLPDDDCLQSEPGRACGPWTRGDRVRWTPSAWGPVPRHWERAPRM